MERAKIMCMCGSLKYTPQLMEQTENLTLQGYNVISVIYETRDRDSYTEDDINMFVELHHQKIDLADAIFVANFGGHIGEGTQGDIDYAKQVGKEVIYLEPQIEKTIIK